MQDFLIVVGMVFECLELTRLKPRFQESGKLDTTFLSDAFSLRRVVELLPIP